VSGMVPRIRKSTPRRKVCVTYCFKSPSSQNPLRSCGSAASIALKIPHDVSSTQLGEHLGDLLDLRWVNTSTGPAGTSGTVVAVKEPSNDEERHYRKGEERRYIQRGLIVMHCVLAERGVGLGFGGSSGCQGRIAEAGALPRVRQEVVCER
jgi:hypothetical protein